MVRLGLVLVILRGFELTCYRKVNNENNSQLMILIWLRPGEFLV